MTSPRNGTPTLPALILALVLALVVAAPAITSAEQTVNRTIPASSDVRVSVECLSGTLRFVVGSSSEVSVRGTTGDGASLEISGEGSKIHIEVEIPDGRRRRNVDASVNLEIQVPKGASLDVETLSASAEVTGVEGEIEIESMSADVTVNAQARALKVETVSGRVRATGVRGDIEIETVSGKVELDRVAGKIEVSAVSGNIEIRDSNLDSGDFESVNASFFFEGRLEPESRVSIESYNGNVELVLPPSTSASFQVESLSGGIDNRFTNDKAVARDRFAPGKTLELVLGSGSASVTIESLSGNVVLRP